MMLSGERSSQNWPDSILLIWPTAIYLLAIALLPNGCHCIIGGNASDFAKNYPFIVTTRAHFTFTNKTTVCTGILIADDKALVAGNCTRYRDIDTTRMTVRPAGEHLYEVYQFIRTGVQGLRRMRELVMLRFSRQRSSAIVTTSPTATGTNTLNAFISAVPWSVTNETDEYALVAGFGRHGRRNPAHRPTYPKSQQPPGYVAAFWLISESRCKEQSWWNMKSQQVDYSVNLCVQPKPYQSLPAICAGDLGAPIFVRRPSGIEILGIVSLRMHDYCETRHATFGLRLGAYLEWINLWLSTPIPWPEVKMFMHTLKREKKPPESTTSIPQLTESTSVSGTSMGISTAPPRNEEVPIQTTPESNQPEISTGDSLAVPEPEVTTVATTTTGASPSPVGTTTSSTLDKTTTPAETTAI